MKNKVYLNYDINGNLLSVNGDDGAIACTRGTGEYISGSFLYEGKQFRNKDTDIELAKEWKNMVGQTVTVFVGEDRDISGGGVNIFRFMLAILFGGLQHDEQTSVIVFFRSLLDSERAPDTSNFTRSALFNNFHSTEQYCDYKIISHRGIQCNLSNSCANEFALRDFQKYCCRVLRHCSARKHPNSTRFLYGKNKSASRRSHQRSISGVSEFRYTFWWKRELASNAAFFQEVA